MTIKHDDAIEWPNGGGFTPCSRAYANKIVERDAIYHPSYDRGGLDDLSPEEYNRYFKVQNELDNMMLAGHVGKPVRY